VSVEYQGLYKKIFTFWEPEESLTPYLQLCLKTWERRLPQYEIIILNYSNLDNYIPAGTYDISLLKKFTLMMQKDAVMVAVLAEHGGIFMDADTIALRDIHPIIEKLNETEAVMFSTHCAFLAARPGSYMLKLWLKVIQNKMLSIPDDGQDLKNLPWDFIANSTLESAMDEIIMSNKLAGAIQKYAVDSWAGYLKDKTKKDDGKAFRGRALLYRISNFILARKRKMFFRTVYKKYLIMLDRVEYGFIPEAKYFPSRFMEPQEKYMQFWFANHGYEATKQALETNSKARCGALYPPLCGIVQLTNSATLRFRNWSFTNNHDIKEVFTNKQTLIGLHNSWTPQWYKDFSEKDVLEHDCLLSRILKHLLENQTAMQ